MKKQYTNWLNEMTGTLLAACFLLVTQSAFAQITTWGNDYIVGNANTSMVNTSNSQWITFTADANDTINQARLNANSASNSPVLDVGLYAVDGNGIPTGAALATGSATATGAGWTTVSLTDYTLTAGTTYALRVSTATAGASFGWRLNLENPANNMQPVGVVDNHWRRGANTGTPSANGQNVWTLGTTTSGKTIGQPYISATAQNIGSATATIGQRFEFDQDRAGGNNFLESVTLYLGIAATQPANPVTMKLISSAGTVLATSSLDLSGATPGAALHTFDLDTPISLTDGSAYYIGLYSNGSVGNSVTWYGWNVTNDAFYINASYQGGDAYAVSWSSQSDYTGAPTALATRDYYFALNLSAIPEPSIILLTGLGFALTLLKRRRI